MSVFGGWALDDDQLILTINSNSFTTVTTSNRESALIAKVNGDILVLKDVDEHGNDRTRTYTKVK